MAFTKTGLKFSDDSELAADVVIFAYVPLPYRIIKGDEERFIGPDTSIFEMSIGKYLARTSSTRRTMYGA